MKNKIKDILIVILTIIIILLIIQLILNKNKITNNNKKIIKEMNEGTQVADLNNQINSLNTAHTEYMNYIQTCKTAIASALTNEGIVTSANDTLETMATNIENIFVERTKLDESVAATANDILSGKQAYANGKLITGTYENPDKEIIIKNVSFTISGTEKSGAMSGSINVGEEILTAGIISYSGTRNRWPYPTNGWNYWTSGLSLSISNQTISASVSGNGGSLTLNCFYIPK